MCSDSLVCMLVIFHVIPGVMLDPMAIRLGQQWPYRVLCCGIIARQKEGKTLLLRWKEWPFEFLMLVSITKLTVITKSTLIISHNFFHFYMNIYMCIMLWSIERQIWQFHASRDMHESFIFSWPYEPCNVLSSLGRMVDQVTRFPKQLWSTATLKYSYFDIKYGICALGTLPRKDLYGLSKNPQGLLFVCRLMAWDGGHSWNVCVFHLINYIYDLNCVHESQVYYLWSCIISLESWTQLTNINLMHFSHNANGKYRGFFMICNVKE